MALQRFEGLSKVEPWRFQGLGPILALDKFEGLSKTF
jgi:hypothetical protein